MSIEKSTASTASSHATAGGSKAKGKGAAEDGFSAILDALGGDDATANGDTSAGASATNTTDASAAAKDGLSDPNAIAAAQALASAGQTTLDATALQALTAQMAQIAQASAARHAGSGEAAALSEDAQRLARTGLSGAKSGHGGADGAAAAATDGQVPGGVLSTQALAARDRAKALADAQSAAAATGTSSATDSNAVSSSTAQTNPADSKDTRLLAAIQQLQSSSAQADKPANAAAATLFRLDQPAAEHNRSAERQSDANNGVATNAVASAGPQGYSDTGASTTAAATGTETQVAEQVKYWISNDVQNAELKLDGLGKDPVQVSISMSGNEANIVFRTDESQARGVLENASAHLRDMLGREGVVLTGVSVGTSGSQQSDSSGAQGRQRSGVRQALVTPAALSGAATAAATGSARAVGQSGRALDLFV